MSYIWSNLDVIKIKLVNNTWHANAPTIPPYFILWVNSMHILRQLVDIFRLSIATHKTKTRYIGTIFSRKTIKNNRSECLANVLPQKLTVTARTMTRTITDIDSKRYLIRYFLENDSGVNVFHTDTCLRFNRLQLLSRIVLIEST